jgi:hypothetical protein
LEEKIMLEKKLIRSLLFLLILLGFSTGGVMGANILFVSSMDAEHMPGDDTIKAFFESLGHTVTYIDDDESESATEEAALASDLVYISESVGSGAIKNEITEVPTPIIVAEPYAWDEMGLIVGGGTNQVPDSANITIIYPGHPMAAGYSGQVPVYTDLPGSELIPAGTTGGDAIVIARASGGTQADADVYFLYEQGATLAVPAADGSGQIAAGIRIGFFATSPTAEQLLTQQAFDLLEAAVNYALGLSREADLASAPSPGNSAEGVPLAPVLRWTPGERAEQHDVYLGTDYDSVNNADRNSTEIFKGTADANHYSPLPLEGGTTYYWRIDEVSEGTAGSPWKGHVWTFTTIPLIASDPSPADGQGASIPLELKWTPGGDVLEHKVYFGTDPNALVYYSTKDADEPSYTVRGLDIGKTYYWRVDEINDGVTYTGYVWSFTVTHRVVDVWFEAEQADEVKTPMGIFPNDQGQDPVVEAGGQGVPSGGFYIGTTSSSSGNNSFWTLDGATYTFTVPAGTYAIWARVSNVDDDSFWVSVPDGQYDVPVDASGWINWNGINPTSANWHWVRVHSDDAPGNAVVNITLTAGSHKMLWLHRENENFLDCILITNNLELTSADLPDEVPELIYPQATKPNPMDGATDVRNDVVLTWEPGAYIDGLSPRHKVFFGDNFDDVNDGIGGVEQDVEYYPATGTLDLELQKTYYWRVDEANNTSGWDKGPTWKFTVADYLVIDDFEFYNTDDNQIWFTWHDGLGAGMPGADPYLPGNGTGSAVGDDTTASYTEESIVHSGSQSMPYWYDNNKQDFANYSEASLTLSTQRDWTKQGVVELSIWFRGYPANVGGFTEAPAGTYTMTATGEDIWYDADQFHYAFKVLSGVGSIEAKVLSVQDTDPWAKAGVMIRETLEPGSKFAAVYITPGNGCRFQARMDTGIDAVSDTSVATDEQMAITAPYWIKLERDFAGNFRGYYSSNGTNWQLMSWGHPNIPMNTDVYVGLVLTSHNIDATCEAKFSNVSIAGTVTAQWQDQDVGILSNDAVPMYVAVTNRTGAPAVIYHDNPDAVQIETWTQWDIDLKQFADKGIDLTDVDKISLGFGDRDNPQPGGAGKMYFDDIRLYLPGIIAGE